MTTSATDALVDSYISTRPKSAALHRAALGRFAARGATHFARAAVPFRPYIERAAGARKWDVDGHEYLDYVVGHGALILGHSHPAVVDAVRDQVGRGVHYGDNHPLEVEWAGLIQEMMPSAERVEYFASGQEANLMAIRLSRVQTGRRKVLRFGGNYHGWADELTGPDAPGTVAEHVQVIEPNDLAALERELATREYALLFVEGGGGFLSGRIPMAPEFYRALPDLCRRYGTVLLLDEVVTGFREAPGGWQSVVGIRPDLTTLGKAVSGGLPSGALVGRAELFTPLDPGAKPGRMVAHGGTWNAVPVTCAAGIAACRLYRDGALQRAARARGDRLIALVNGVLAEVGVPGRCWGRSIMHLAFDVPGVDSKAVELRLDLHLLQRGVASIRGQAFILSAAHTERDLELTAEALGGSLVAMRAEGTLG